MPPLLVLVQSIHKTDRTTGLKLCDAAKRAGLGNVREERTKPVETR